MTPKLALYLREYKQERKGLFQKMGKELSLDDLVFYKIDGKPVDPGAAHDGVKPGKLSKLEPPREPDGPACLVEPENHR